MPLRRLFFALCLLAAPGLRAEPAADLSRRWVVYGQGLAAQGKAVEAEQAFDKAVNLDPSSAAAHEARGHFLWRQAKADAGLADLRHAVQLDPSRKSLAAWIAALDAGKAALTAGGATPADDGGEQLLEAQALLDGGDAAGALPLFEQGAQRAWAPAPVWALGRAQSLYSLGRFDEARQVLDAARAKDPSDTGLKRLQERYFHPGLEEDQGGGSPWGSMLRSAILPGWGQAHNGQSRKAFTLGTLTLGLLAATAVTYVAADQAIADYQALGPGTPASDFDAAFSRADGLALTNQALGITFYAVYAYNIFDAGAQARPAPKPTAAGPRLTLLALSF